jgi:hypothetical protein
VTKHVQDSKRRQSRDEAGEQEAAAQDLRDEQLDEDVACCLAEIDKVLEEESERDRAVREFRELVNADDYHQAERVWQAQYAHLGLRIASGCCTVALWDDKAKKAIEKL